MLGSPLPGAGQFPSGGVPLPPTALKPVCDHQHWPNNAIPQPPYLRQVPDSVWGTAERVAVCVWGGGGGLWQRKYSGAQEVGLAEGDDARQTTWARGGGVRFRGRETALLRQPPSPLTYTTRAS